MTKEINLKVKKGIIKVSPTAHIVRQTKTIMLLEIDCDTKRPRISGEGGSTETNTECIMLDADKETIYTHPTRTNDTIIYMPKDWKIFCAEVSKYTLYITLTK